MTKIVGFNKAVADAALEQKKEQQRKGTIKHNTRHIHLVRKDTRFTIGECVTTGGLS